MADSLSYTIPRLAQGFMSDLAPYSVQTTEEDWPIGRVWPTVAHLHMALRVGLWTDWAEMIRNEKTGMDAKTKYRELVAKGLKPPVARRSAEDVRNMVNAIDLKVQQHKEVQRLLLATGDAMLVFDQTKQFTKGKGDLFWGARKLADGTWEGQNVHGMIWTGLRVQLKRRMIEEQRNGEA